MKQNIIKSIEFLKDSGQEGSKTSTDEMSSFDSVCNRILWNTAPKKKRGNSYEVSSTQILLKFGRMF